MAACCGKSSRHEGNDSKRGREPDEEERLTPNELNLQEVHGIITDTAKKNCVGGSLSKDPNEAVGVEPQPMHDDGSVSRNVLGSLELSASLWGVGTAQWRGDRADTLGILPRTEKNDDLPAQHTSQASQRRGANVPGKAFVHLTEHSATKCIAKIDARKHQMVSPESQLVRDVIISWP